MPRILRKTKPFIRVFCEGESEEVYTDFLKQQFDGMAVIQHEKRLFEEVESLYKKSPKYLDEVEITDEIWFFFDVEVDDAKKWDKREAIIKRLRRMKKNNKIRVRLLMTTACIEYWLLLHYEKRQPSLSPSFKEDMLEAVQTYCPHYEKGDKNSTFDIASHYIDAAKNGNWTLKMLVNDGIPTIEDTDERNRWLYLSQKTFTTTHEAVEYLQTL